MRYPAKELKAEAYKAYSKDAFNDEERGVAYYLHNCRYKLTAGEIDKFDDIQCVPIDAMHYIDTALPGNDIIILTAADNSDKKIPMSLVDWFWTIDRNLIEWYNVGNKQSSGEYKVSVPSRLYEKWANYQRRPNSYKKQHPKPSTKDGVLIENCGIDYYFKTTFFASRAYAEIVYKKYTHVHGTPKLEWLAVPECVPISNLELDDYIFYERESALNLAIEISSALIDCHELDKAHGNGNRIFYNITLFELKQRLLPDLLKSDAIYFRIAVARTFIYALRSRLTDQMNSGWEAADSQTQYRKIEAWVAQIASYLRNILRNPPRLFAESEHTSSEEIHALIQMHYPILFCDSHEIMSSGKAYPKVCEYKKSEPTTPTSFAIFCNPEHPNVNFYLKRICAYSRALLKAKETCGEGSKLPNILRCRDSKLEIFTEVYQSISAEMEKIKNS